MGINNYSLVIGVEESLKPSYFVTSLLQSGIYHKFYKDYKSALQDGIRILIWESDLSEIKSNVRIFIFVSARAYISSFNLKNYSIHKASYFKIDHKHDDEIKFNFMIKRDVYSFRGLGTNCYGASFDSLFKEIDFSGINHHVIENNNYIIFPFDLTKETIGQESDYRQFYSQSNRGFYVEYGPTIDYFELRNLLLNFYIFAFNKLGLPLIQLIHPYEKKGVYTIRIDADGYDYDDFNNTLKVGVQTKKKFNWYLDFYSLGKYDGFKFIKGILSSGHSVNLHSFRHMVYKSFVNNFTNLFIAIILLRIFKLKDYGVVSPFGFYNASYQKAINIFKFNYSSDFGYNVFDRPSYPLNNNKYAIQIPSNPSSIKTLAMSNFTVENIFEHLYYETINKSDLNGYSVLYDHPSHGISKFSELYIDLINKLDLSLDYVSMDNIAESYKSFYDKLQLNDKHANTILSYDNKYFFSLNKGFKQETLSQQIKPDYFIPYENYSLDEDLRERINFYDKHFKREQNSGIIEFIFRYFIPSLFIFFSGLFLKKQA